MFRVHFISLEFCLWWDSIENNRTRLNDVDVVTSSFRSQCTAFFEENYCFIVVSSFIGFFIILISWFRCFGFERSCQDSLSLFLYNIQKLYLFIYIVYVFRKFSMINLRYPIASRNVQQTNRIAICFQFIFNELRRFFKV